jgi:hypothetical protein
MEFLGGIRVADGGEAKIVTGADDHSGSASSATVVRRATGRECERAASRRCARPLFQPVLVRGGAALRSHLPIELVPTSLLQVSGG